jgi:hypothetical protein
MARSLKDATRPMDTTNLKVVTPPAATPRPALKALSHLMTGVTLH